MFVKEVATGRFSPSRKKKKKMHELHIRNKEEGINSKVLPYSIGNYIQHAERNPNGNQYGKECINA